MKIVPIQAIPNQTLTIQLESNLYEITVRATNGVMSVDIMRDNVQIVRGARAVSNYLIMPYRYLEVGNFFFATQNNALPYYDQFGVSQKLIYVSADELAAARNLPFFFLPKGAVPLRDGGTW